MNAREFFDRVRLMRRLQRDYAVKRTQAALRRSAEAERLVDAEIGRVEARLGIRDPVVEQGELFGGDGDKKMN